MAATVARSVAGSVRTASAARSVGGSARTAPEVPEEAVAAVAASDPGEDLTFADVFARSAHSSSRGTRSQGAQSNPAGAEPSDPAEEAEALPVATAGVAPVEVAEMPPPLEAAEAERGSLDSRALSGSFGSRSEAADEALLSKVFSAPVLKPKPPPPPRALYEVASGLVAVRPAPRASSAAMCVLKGGVRFYGVPYQFGRSSWLKLQTYDVEPPLFAASGNAEDAWVRNDEKAIAFIRRGRPGVPATPLRVRPAEQATELSASGDVLAADGRAEGDEALPEASRSAAHLQTGGSVRSGFGGEETTPKASKTAHSWAGGSVRSGLGGEAASAKASKMAARSETSGSVGSGLGERDISAKESKTPVRSQMGDSVRSGLGREDTSAKASKTMLSRASGSVRSGLGGEDGLPEAGGIAVHSGTWGSVAHLWHGVPVRPGGGHDGTRLGANRTRAHSWAGGSVRGGEDASPKASKAVPRSWAGFSVRSDNDLEEASWRASEPALNSPAGSSVRSAAGFGETSPKASKSAPRSQAGGSIRSGSSGGSVPLDAASQLDMTQGIGPKSNVTVARFSPSLSKAEWAGCGTGAWCNFRRYGTHGGPPNNNCGRWRQLPD